MQSIIICFYIQSVHFVVGNFIHFSRLKIFLKMHDEGLFFHPNDKVVANELKMNLYIWYLEKKTNNNRHHDDDDNPKIMI